MKKKALLASALTVLALTAAPVTAQAGITSPTPPIPPTDMVSPTASPTGTATDMAAPFGPGCASLPASGKGSLEEMAKQPVATAAAGNPELSTLSSAIKEAGLEEKLNSAEDITVFAPNNDAFDKIPKETIDRVMGDKEQLTKILNYHVVSERQSPEDLSDATLDTMEGGTLTVKGSGEDYTVNDAKVLCGNIPTANGVVYIIDSVLMPQAEESPTSEVSPS